MKKTITTILTLAAIFQGFNSNAQCSANLQISADVNGEVTFTDQSSAQSAMSDVTTKLKVERYLAPSDANYFADSTILWPNSGTVNIQFPSNEVFHFVYSIEDNLTGCTDIIAGEIDVFNHPSTCTGSVSHFESEGVAYLIDNSTNVPQGTLANVSVAYHSNPANVQGVSYSTHDLNLIPEISEVGFSVAGTYTYKYMLNDYQGCSQLVYEVVTIDTVTCIEVGIDAEEFAEEWGFHHEYNPNRGYVYSYDFGDGVATGFSPFAVGHEYSANGTYLVCMTMKNDYGCQFTTCDSITVTNVHPPCEANFIAHQDSANPNTYYGYNYSQADNITYAWDFGDGSPISNAQSPIHQYANPGTYTICLTITGDGGCVDSICQTVTYTQKASTGYFFQIVPEGETAEISKLKPFSNLSIYPNPTNGLLKVNSDIAITQYEIRDLNGRVVASSEVEGSHLLTVDLTMHEKGIYLMMVKDANGITSTPQRIIIK